MSLGLAAAGVVCTLISRLVEHGTWAYDFWMGFGAGFGTNAVMVVMFRVLWEKDADPTKKPKPSSSDCDEV